MTTNSLKIDVLTLFPKMIEDACSHSIVARGLNKGSFSLACHNIRDFGKGKYQKVDDTLVGGGSGMLIQCEPIWQTLQTLLTPYWQNKKLPSSKDELKKVSSYRLETLPRRIFLSPKGRVLTQDLVKELAKEKHLILLCGHYEGVDDRVLQEGGFEEISIGDYVLTGGELPALVLIDAVIRMLPDVIASDVTSNETHFSGLLEAPQYTKPAIWRDIKVPDVLLSGHHAKIKEYQYLASLKETLKKRPDLFDKLNLDNKDLAKFVIFLENDNKLENNSKTNED